MKIASFNVNSIRSRIDIVTNWLTANAPDVLCVQETKAQDVDFPTEPFDNIGYNYAFKGQKSYNGVAIFTQHKIKNVTYGFDDEPKDQSRFITAQINGVNIINTYIPQGFERDSEKFEYKLNWFERLKKYFDKNFTANDNIIWVGDLNVAPTAIDVHTPDKLEGNVCFCDEVRDAFQSFIKWGFVDIFRKHCTDAGQFTFWDYRVRGGLSRNQGWRLDHILATKPMADKSTASYIDREPRKMEKPSDHTPIIAEFEI